MNRFFFIAVALCMFAISCTTPEEEVYHQVPLKADTLIKQPPVIPVIIDSTYDSALVKFPAVTEALKRWFDFYKKTYPGFDMAAFTRQGISRNVSTGFTTKPEEMSAENLALYKNLFIYSPDHSSLIDMDTYNFFLSKDKSGHLVGEGGDPETEVALVDLEKHTRTQLFYTGPFTVYEDAGWLDQSRMVIVSLDGNEKPGTYIPNIVLIDFASDVAIYYTYLKKITADPKAYESQVRLKGIKIK